MIEISDYDRIEAEATTRLSYPAIRAFRPAAFALVNFPTRVAHERELIRYADCMHELADARRYYETELYSEAEADLIIGLSEQIERLTEDLFGRSIQPYMSLFPPILIMRAVTALCPDGGATIWEIGPGSGHLGAYLIGGASNARSPQHKYRSTDNTQSLYLWQDRIFERIGGSGYKNYASQIDPPAVIAERCASIPWWQFARLFEESPSADIIVCDAAMGEMDAFAANYIIRLAAKMMKNSRVGAFLLRNIGAQMISSMAYIEQRFEAAGFFRNATKDVIVFSLRRFDLPENFAPIGTAGKMQPAKRFLHIDEEKTLESYRFFDFMCLR